jgi:hypothetical protein
MALQHGRDHDQRWSHKNQGIRHGAQSDLDPDEDVTSGMKDKDRGGRRVKIRKRTPRAHWYR